jgi:predicted phage terminase large subunit-like protein
MSNALLQIKPDQYLEEASARMLASEDMASFGEYIYPDWYRAYDMHRYIAFYCEQVLKYLAGDTKNGIQNLMILTPPQHGKSVTVSNVFPAYALGKMPNLRILMGSYGADLSTDNSREVRNIVLSSAYQAVFGKFSASDEPVRVSSDSRATAKWDLAAPHRGGMIATGVGGAFTGRAKGLVILDDLIKDHRAAESQDARDDVWDWLKSSVVPRAKAMLLVMTHWHPDDPAGRFMKLMVTNPRAKQWTIIALPGFALERDEYATSIEEQREKMLEGIYLPMKDPLDRDPGDVLCPAIMTREEMLTVKETSDDYFFSALYQQQPYSKEGQKYKREWFRKVTKLPEGVKIIYLVRYWDKANSSKGDFTVGVLMAYCSDGLFYILDVARFRKTSGERDSSMKRISEADRNTYGKVYIWHQQDPGSAGKDSAEATNRLLMGFPVKYEPVSGDKEDRSDPLESAFQGGLVYLLQAAWNDAFVEECVAFPRGNHDDQVDAASSAYNKLLSMLRKIQKEVKSYPG